MKAKPLPDARGPASPGRIRVSVIIPSFNARETILDGLAALSRQAGDLAREVIVADSSEDGTADLVRRRFPEVRVLELPRRTHPGTARNLGARRARGEILAFTDADCRPGPRWLERLAGLHRAASAAAGPAPAITGSIENGAPSSRIGTADWFLEFSGSCPGLPPAPRDFAPTANLSLPRSLFFAAGGFDDSRTAEDIAFGWRLRAAGHSIRFDAGARIHHRGRTRLGPFCRKQFELGLGSALVRKRFPLPGSWVVRVPPLVPLLLPYRLFRIVRRVGRADPRRLGAFVLALPAILTGLFAWVLGFTAGSLRGSPPAGWSFEIQGLSRPPGGRRAASDPGPDRPPAPPPARRVGAAGDSR